MPESLFDKDTGLMPATLLKKSKDSDTGVFL